MNPLRRFRLVNPLPPGRAGDGGEIGPGSIVWWIARERAVLLGGPTALLLQVAHPLVAEGVKQHSNFEEDPLARLIATLNATLITTFGDTEQARATARTVTRRHASVKGVLTQDVGSWAKSTRYNARDPEQALWVYATLVEVALDTYSAFVRQLDFDERARYYDESAPFGRLFGVTAAVRPESYWDFCEYYARMINQRLVVGDNARQIARGIFAAKLWGMPVNPVAKILAAGLLPEQLVADYGLSSGPIYRTSFWLLQQIVRHLLPRAPARMRYWPHYRVASKRTAS